MKDKGTGLMEKQIFSEEGAQEPEGQLSQVPKTAKKMSIKPPTFENLLSLFEKSSQLIKNPKVIIILGLIVAIMAAFIALISLSTKPKEPPKADTKLNIPSPTPKVDIEIENLKKQVDTFNVNLEEIDRETKDLKFPQVDLDIKF